MWLVKTEWRHPERENYDKPLLMIFPSKDYLIVSSTLRMKRVHLCWQSPIVVCELALVQEHMACVRLRLTFVSPRTRHEHVTLWLFSQMLSLCFDHARKLWPWKRRSCAHIWVCSVTIVHHILFMGKVSHEWILTSCSKLPVPPAEFNQWRALNTAFTCGRSASPIAQHPVALGCLTEKSKLNNAANVAWIYRKLLTDKMDTHTSKTTE